MPKVKTKLGQENKLIHPNSRKADAISREWHRDVRVKKKKKETAHKMTALGEKIAWFRDQIDEDVTVLTPEMIGDLMEGYLARFDDELEQIRLKNQVGQRKGNQHASREDTILHTKKLERDEYEGFGFEIPALDCPKNVEYLKSWDGELRFIPNIVLKRYRKKNLETSIDSQSGNKTDESPSEEMVM